jgi:hypothetical protein
MYLVFFIVCIVKQSEWGVFGPGFREDIGLMNLYNFWFRVELLSIPFGFIYGLIIAKLYSKYRRVGRRGISTSGSISGIMAQNLEGQESLVQKESDES